MINVILLLLIGHFLADYYLQNDKMADRKKEKIGHLFLHGLIYLVVSCLLVLPYARLDLLILAVLVTMSHLIIDGIKYGVNRQISGQRHSKTIRKLRQWEEKGYIYLWDQLLHMAAMFALFYAYDYYFLGGINGPIFSDSMFLNNHLLRYVLAVLIILKPTNITFREMFQQVKPASEKPFVKDLNVGKRIGNMERLLVLVLLGLNQYTAIGLVFTAKSVTRYKRITDDPAFSEYYLLGTLFSILATLAVYLILIM